MAAKDSLPKRALTSFPGSGVTWTRQLIEGATGIYTGSVYQMDPLPVKSLGTFHFTTRTGLATTQFILSLPIYRLDFICLVSCVCLCQNKEMENANTDDPLCGCTIIDKDHEATISATANLSDYYELLHRWVCLDKNKNRIQCDQSKT